MGWVIALSAVLAVVLAVGTLLWWKVGDLWADSEHRRFKGSDRGGRHAPPSPPRIIRTDGDGPRPEANDPAHGKDRDAAG